MRTIITKENKSMKNKIIISGAFLLVLFSLPACNAVSGAYSDDPYGPVVSCDSTLPMDELLQCVDKKYAAMDALHESPRVKDDKQYQFRDRSRNNYDELPFSYKKISEFTSIKSCYKQDRCQAYSIGDGRGLTNYDEYEERKIRVESLGRNVMGEAYEDTLNNNKIDKTLKSIGWIGSFGSTPTYFIRSYKNPYKDIIIYNQNNKASLYVPLIELINLKDKQTLVVANINRFCLGKQPEWWIGKVKNNHFVSCGVYRLSYVTDKIEVNVPVPVFISLDKRVNPNKIYLKVDQDIFEIDINNQGESK